jgi:hypothetical protein
MIRLELDAQGRLILFEAMPPQVFPASSQAAFNWNTLFTAADLDPAQFQPATPAWNSLSANDTRAAWTGRWPGTDRPLRVEAAAFQGKPVFFRLIGDWTQPSRMQTPPETAGKKATEIIMILLITAMFVVALWLARRNYRQGRGDRQGALLLAKIFFVTLIALWLLQSHLVPGLETMGLMILDLSTALFLSAMIFVLYLALEPYVRRYWPQAVISWSRLLTGRVRDPIVGRDVLLGVLLGVIWIVIFKASAVVEMRMGLSPDLLSTAYLVSTRRALGMWLLQWPLAVFGTLQFFFFFLGLKVLLKKDWLATIAFVAIFTTNKAIGSDYLAVTIVTLIVIYLIAAVIVYRFGLLPLACAIFTVDLLGNISFTADLSAWYMGMSMFALLSVVALAGWGFYYSRGGEQLWGPNP